MEILNVAILHDPVPDDAPPEARDTLDQAWAVRDALASRGVAACLCPTDGRAAELARIFANRPPGTVAFNLVESPEGRDDLASRVPRALRRMRVPFTGSGAVALDATNDKPRAKRRMARAGLRTPPGLSFSTPSSGHDAFAPGRYLIKPAGDHASVGLDDDSVVPADTPARLADAVRARAARSGRPHFAELFVDGREFNVGLLSTPDGVRALPPAEIAFVDFPPGKPRIVGYAAKWHTDSFEYAHTVRRLAFPPSDGPLLARLTADALRAWRVFHLRGYARVDFRVDADGVSWLLEINANPCLTPGAGFSAMLERAGIPFAEAVAWIVDAAV